VVAIKAPPTQLAPQVLFDATAISDLETSSPRSRSILGAFWSMNSFSVNLRETVYGKSSRLNSLNGGTYFKSEIGITPVTDLELAYQGSDWKLAVGANNLFNEYPDQVNEDLLNVYRAALDNFAVGIYPAFSPFGINGGFYYGRLTYDF